MDGPTDSLTVTQGESLASAGIENYPVTSKLMRHYATSRKVAGSIPDEVIEFFLFA
jgi:hypothetical protein